MRFEETAAIIHTVSLTCLAHFRGEYVRKTSLSKLASSWLQGNMFWLYTAVSSYNQVDNILFVILASKRVALVGNFLRSV